ncbi:DsbA family protein [Paracoccus aerodenitrificans]|uniref:DsbA family protein n=1 Tax=Paracoccus aerodenitrificans TaxID=3017781 RepID=UPI0022F06218|nr:DsbA family protein [Paracoccus aerodenitrificans]WBU64141.1 DsbA family protein [Paracoccus aerodenitrificans]
MTDHAYSGQTPNRRRIILSAIAASGIAFARPGTLQAQQPHPNPMPEELRRVIERNPALPVLGNPEGNITLTEFFDYNCQFCRANMRDVQRLIGEDPQLRVVFREWPVFGDGSFFAAKASLASLQQQKYWQFHEALMQMNARAEEATVMRAARNVGLDTDRLRADMEKRAILDQIYETMDLADTMALTGTPTFIAGHEAVFGRLGLDDLRKLVADAREDLL